MRFVSAVLSLLLVVSACGASSEPENLDDPNVRSKLRTLGLQASSNAGVASPRTMNAVWSADHQAAEQILSGAILNDHAPVYIVVMTGGPFSASEGGPNGIAPQGSALRLTINAQTFEGTDYGITRDAPDLHLIGPHVVDLLAD